MKLTDSITVAKHAVFRFNGLLRSTRAKSPDEFLRKLHDSKNAISSALKEPLVKNALNYVLFDIPKYSIPTAKGVLNQRIQYALEHLSSSSKNIAHYGHPKIKNGMVVFIHGYSPIALTLLLKAKQSNIQFSVHNTECRPSFSGRLMASILSKNNIKVRHFADIALRQALKGADLVISDAYLFTEHGPVYGSIGAELVAEMAEKFDVPLYLCMDTWKFNPSPYYVHEHDIEKTGNELWAHAPNLVKPLNFSFEKVDPRLITGIITEQGIYKVHYLLSDIRKQQPWMQK